MNIFLKSDGKGLFNTQIDTALIKSIEKLNLKHVLIIPPDISRMHSYAGNITQTFYAHLTANGCNVDILPALGTHVPMTAQELDEMYPGIPHDVFIVHNWKTDCVHLGDIPAEYTGELSEGLFAKTVPVEINKHLLDAKYDLIISIGQVVPHEVVGMANYNKNLFVGCGGSGMINASHYIGALYGMERIMGRDQSPVHQLFDYAHKNFLSNLPILFVLTVTTVDSLGINVECLSIGDKRDTFEKAIDVSQQKNIIFTEKPIKKAVVYLDPKEFKSTWIGNKAIYRTRMCIEDGGELLVLAPGIKTCGEDSENDRLIKKYGYTGRDRICALAAENADLRENLSVAAHIIHSSSEGRFKITYATAKMSEEEVNAIGYNHMPYDEAVKLYSTNLLKPGFNNVNGEEIFFIPNPAVGLWARKKIFNSCSKK